MLNRPVVISQVTFLFGMKAGNFEMESQDLAQQLSVTTSNCKDVTLRLLIIFRVKFQNISHNLDYISRL